MKTRGQATNCNADKALQRALAESEPQNWIVHQTVVDSHSLRQFFAVGIRCTPHPSVMLNYAFVCVETVRRRVHAFRYVGPTVRLEDGALEELGALADAIYDQGFHDCSSWSIDYVEGVGCRIPETHIKPSYSGHMRGRRVVTRLCIPRGGGEFGAWFDLPLLNLDLLEEAVGKCAIKMFIRNYPQFETADWTPMQPLIIAARARIDTFVAGLQPAALDACRLSERDSVRAFNAFASSEDRIARFRGQAAAAFPILGLLCAERWEPDMLAIRLAIDRRLPLIETAARSFDVRKDVIRFLAGKSMDHLGLNALPKAERFWIDSPGVVLKALDAIEPDHRPRERADWLAFHHFIGQFDEWHTIPRELIQPFFRDAGKRGLQATREWMAKRYASESAIADCKDFLDSLAGETTLTDEDWMVGATAMWHFIVARGMRKVLDDSRKWHSAFASEAASRLSVLKDLESEPASSFPFDVPKAIDGFQIVFLDRYSALVEEGLRMSHCISTLYADARTGSRLPFSVRTLEGRSLASFDISLMLHPSGFEAVLNELRGYRNAHVPDDCKQAVTRFLVLVQGEARAHQEATQAWLEEKAEARVCEPGHDIYLRAAKRAAVLTVVGGQSGLERIVGSDVRANRALVQE